MARLLGNDAHLVSYGAMSKQPLSLPTSLFIFKNLTSHGFWQSRWYLQRSRAEQEQLMQILINLMSQGKVSQISLALFRTNLSLQLKEPKYEIVSVGARDSDEEAGQKVREIVTKISGGHHGKKVLLKLDEE